MVLNFAIDEDKELIERYIIFKGKCLENRLRNIEEIARLFKISEELKR
jgi:hypothetical protein